jgi:hypothetical protein
MPLDIQTGGFADKIRRALGVRGRMPLRLDETVVPVVNTGTLDQPPYRTDGTDFVCNVDMSAVAAKFTWGGIQLPPSVPGALVVEGMYVVNLGAADSYTLFLGSQRSYDAIDTAAPTQNPINVEHYPPEGLAVNPRSMPFNQNTKGADAVLGLGELLMTIRLLTDTGIYLPVRFTLRPGWAAAWWRRTVNLGVNVTFWGTYFPEIVLPSQ